MSLLPFLPFLFYFYMSFLSSLIAPCFDVLFLLVLVAIGTSGGCFEFGSFESTDLWIRLEGGAEGLVGTFF